MSEQKPSKQRFAGKICEYPPDSRSEEAKRMTQEPEYVCRNCGQSSGNRKNLCQPEKLYSTW